MRKSLWIILAVMVAAVSAPNAHADTVTLDVSGTFSPAGAGESCSSTPPSCVLGGTLVFNNVTGAIISADITFTGSSPAVGPFTSFFLMGGVSSFTVVDFTDASFNLVALVFQTPTQGSLVGYAGGSLNTLTDIGGNGSILFQLLSGSLTPEVTAPEPSSVALMLLGVGLVFLLRKRNSRGHQLAA